MRFKSSAALFNHSSIAGEESSISHRAKKMSELKRKSMKTESLMKFLTETNYEKELKQ